MKDKKNRGQVFRLVGNTASMLSSDTIGRIATFLLYVLVGRYLGTQSFGRMSLALTLLVTFQVLASAGLRLLITREVASDRSKTNSYLINGSLVATVFSLLSLGILILLNVVLSYSSETSGIILLFGLGLLPFSLSTVCEAVFQAWERMGYIVLINLPRNVLVVGMSFWLVSAGHGLRAIGVILLISNWLMVGAEWGIILRRISRPKFKPNFAAAVAMTRSSITFMGLQGVIAISGSFIYVLLSILVSEKDVGFYNAATQIITPVALIYESILVAGYPLLCQRFNIGVQALKRVSDRLFELVLVIAIPAAVGMFFVGGKALLLIYADKEFGRSDVVLRIMAASLIMSAMSAVIGKTLIAGLREKNLLRIVSIKFLVNMVCGYILIKAFGLLGAAINFLVMSVLDTSLHFYQASRLYSKVFPWTRIWKPALATLGMTIFLLVKPELGVVLEVVIGGLIYAGLWLALSIWSAGNVRQFKADYFGA